MKHEAIIRLGLCVFIRKFVAATKNLKTNYTCSVKPTCFFINLRSKKNNDKPSANISAMKLILEMYLEPTIIIIVFRDFLMFYQILISPQVKRCVIITYKHGIYELPNQLILRILKNIRKVSKLHRMIP